MKKFAAAIMSVSALTLLAGCSKPDESELRKNVVEDAKTAGLDDAKAEEFADCATPKLHEELSASSLETVIEDGLEGAKIDADDADAGDKILEECLTEVDAI